MLSAGVIVLTIFHLQSHMPIVVCIVGAIFMGIAANIFYFSGAITEFILSLVLKKSELPLYRGFAYLAGILGSLALFALITLAQLSGI